GPDHFSLIAPVGPATLRAWGGKKKKEAISVAWAQIGKSYVSYHLMALYGSVSLVNAISKDLKAHMHGKTCFNFTSPNESLFKELDILTARGIAGMKKAGFTAGET